MSKQQPISKSFPKALRTYTYRKVIQMLGISVWLTTSV